MYYLEDKISERLQTEVVGYWATYYIAGGDPYSVKKTSNPEGK